MGEPPTACDTTSARGTQSAHGAGGKHIILSARWSDAAGRLLCLCSFFSSYRPMRGDGSTFRQLGPSGVKPVLNWANVCSPEHTSDTSTNYDSFLN